MSSSEVPNDNLPPARCFKRAPKLPWKNAVYKAMTFFEDNLPEGRPDLADLKPDDDDRDTLITCIEDELPRLKSRPAVAALVASCNLTDDDIAALHLFKLEQPYPFYRMYNAWMLGNRRDPEVVENIGPCFNLQYYAISKLPIVTKKAARGAIVRNIPGLKDTFESYEQRLAPGQTLSFWAFSSFSTNDAVVSKPWFSGKADEEAIIYTCAALPGVDMEPFKPDGMPVEDEILPLCPAVFTVHVAMKLNNKLTVALEYDAVRSWERAYVVPVGPKPSPGPPKPDPPTEDLSIYKGRKPKYTTLLGAAEHIDGVESIKILIANGVDVKTCNSEGRSALYIASREGHSEVVKLLHSLGADVSTPENSGVTPVYIAARQGHSEVVKVLHSLGADVSTPKNDGCTPVYIAAQEGHSEVVKVLHSLGADVRSPKNDGATPVYIAAFNGHSEVVKLLHSLGADVRTPRNDGPTPVFVAAFNGHSEVVKLLHSLGADVSTPMNDGPTPVYIAAQNGHSEVVKLLHSLGADVRTPMNDGPTPVWSAAWQGHSEVVKLLHSLGADVSTPTNDGATSVYVAAQNGHSEVVKLLHSLGADVRTPMNNGATPVYIAAFNGHSEVVKLLHSLGADVRTPNKNGTTPVCIAAQNGHSEVVKVLHALGAQS